MKPDYDIIQYMVVGFFYKKEVFNEKPTKKYKW